MSSQYECAMSGIVEEGSPKSDSDGLGELPAGWTKVTFQRRQYNPKWIAIQQVKEATVDALLQQFPEEVRDVQRYVVQIQVEAQLHSLEKDTPMYILDVDDEVYLSDSNSILESINEIRENMGLTPVEGASDSDEEDEEKKD